jgi:hypothetical protein
VVETEVPVLADAVAALGRAVDARARAPHMIAATFAGLAVDRRRVGFLDADVDVFRAIFERARHDRPSMGVKS